jgi:hypothetical protein
MKIFGESKVLQLEKGIIIIIIIIIIIFILTT